MAVGDGPFGVAVTPGGDFVYVANFFTGTVSVIQTTAPNTVVDTVDVGGFPMCVAVSPDGDFVFVANGGSNNVSVIRTSANYTVVDTVDVGDLPFSLGLFITPTTGLGDLMGDGDGNSSNSCAMASSTAANLSFPVYLLIPAFILIARLRRRRTN